MRSFLSLIFIVAAIAGATFAGIHFAPALSPRSGQASGADRPPMARLERRTVVDEIEAIGLVRARESSILSAPFSGRLRRLVPEGSFVQAGEVVAEMDTKSIEETLADRLVDLELRRSELEQRQAEYQLQVTQNALELEAEQSRLEYARIALQDARRRFDEQRVLLERNLISQSTLDSERLRLLQAELDLKEAEINMRKLVETHANRLLDRRTEIEKAQVNLDRVQKRVEEERDQLDKAMIRATRDGYVSYLNTWRGRRTKIAEGDQVYERNGIIEIPDARQMQVSIPVHELDITRVEVGQVARIHVAAIPGETFTGTVNRRSSVPLTNTSNPFGETREGVKLFEVFIAFDAQDDRFRQNMTATAVVEVRRAENVLAAPIESVFERRDEDGNTVHFVLVGGQSEPAEVVVTPGVRGLNFVEITDAAAQGLSEGTELYLRDPRQAP